MGGGIIQSVFDAYVRRGDGGSKIAYNSVQRGVEGKK